MNWEFVIVLYTRARDVFMAGHRVGEVGTVLRIRRGTWTFALGEPVDYWPPSQTVRVMNTSAMRPRIIAFQPK